MIDPDPLKPLSDEFIDRIVGGELTPAELRDAVNRLDCQPDAWKRCALAFLEAQCWRESLEDYRSTIPTSSRLRTSVVDLAGDHVDRLKAGKAGAAQGNARCDGRRIVRTGLGSTHLAAVDRFRPGFPGHGSNLNSPAGNGIREILSR